MNQDHIRCETFSHLSRTQQLCKLSSFIKNINADPNNTILKNKETIDVLSERCFSRSNLTKVEMHLYQNILLAQIPRWTDYHYYSIFNIQNTTNEWDTHFLIRCLKGLCKEDCQPVLLICVQQLLESWLNTGHCICHLLERCLRLLSIEELDGGNQLCEYLAKHSSCYSKYYYKVLCASLSVGDLSNIRKQLDNHSDEFNPYYIQAYFKLSEAEGHVLPIPFLVEEKLDSFLSILAEKDTLFISVVCSMAGFSLVQDTDIVLHFFYRFLEKYDYDVDIILSMLDESDEILFALSRLCRVINKYKSFPYASNLINYFVKLRDMFEVVERRGLLNFSIAPIIRRISSILPFSVFLRMICPFLINKNTRLSSLMQ